MDAFFSKALEEHTMINVKRSLKIYFHFAIENIRTQKAEPNTINE